MSTIKVDAVKSSVAGIAPVIRDLNDVEVSQGCTAWVNFNGTGTLNNSFNVIGVTNNGSGDYTVNFATNMVSASYCVVATGVYVNTPWQQGTHVHTKYTTSVRVISTLVNATGFQPWSTDLSLAIFGGK